MSGPRKSAVRLSFWLGLSRGGRNLSGRGGLRGCRCIQERERRTSCWSRSEWRAAPAIAVYSAVGKVLAALTALGAIWVCEAGIVRWIAASNHHECPYEEHFSHAAITSCRRIPIRALSMMPKALRRVRPEPVSRARVPRCAAALAGVRDPCACPAAVGSTCQSYAAPCFAVPVLGQPGMDS